MVVNKPVDVELQKDIRCLLISRTNTTLRNLRYDYKMLIGDDKLRISNKELKDLLDSIPGVSKTKLSNGLELWNASSEATAHISQMIVRQRRPRKHSHGRRPRPKKPRAKAKVVNPLHCLGYYCGHQLVGDDYFLGIVRTDFGVKTSVSPSTGTLCVANCISGLTIRQLTQQLNKKHTSFGEKVVVHIGAIDVLQGRSFGDILVDYLDMVKAFKHRGIDPLLCTIAPFAHKNTPKEARRILKRINNFIRGNSHWRVLDLEKIFARRKGSDIIMCLYLPSPTMISGCDEPVVLWNRLGRQTALIEIRRLLYKK